MLLFIVATTICFGIVAIPVIPLLYSAEFEGAVPALLALLPGIMAMGYTKILANYMAAIGKPEMNAKNASIGLVINILANLLLIPRWEIVGASVSTSLSYISISVLCYRDFVRLSESRWYAPLIAQTDDLRHVAAMVRKILQPVSTRIFREPS